MDKGMFNLHLKQCEFRFNNREQGLYNILLKRFKKEPLNLAWSKNIIVLGVPQAKQVRMTLHNSSWIIEQ
ncbi:MAG: hypothetical protein A6F72_03700 [Cycloclasticus sp. symbiont of Poecilosclerida sp. N]|nr:MAG: hypothetical protein A6F72_03700 [Cycloclasticus sp. symbiont of Poecilosclerida sp. N]